MGRIRTIKPDFFRDEKLQDVQAANPSLNPMLVFAGLWTVADKNGVFEWLPRTLKLDILPFLEFDLGASLALLERFSFISRYEVGDKSYGIVAGFTKHQRINGKEAMAESKFPGPHLRSDGEVPGVVPESQEGKGNRKGKGMDRVGNEISQIDRQVHEIASLYPKIHDAFNLTHEVAIAIAEAIGRDGRDLVWAGTKCAGEAMALWAPEMKQFIPSPPRFFRESQYRKDPAEWERRDSGKSKNVASDRVAQQLEAVAIAKRSLGLAH